ncbi:Pathogenesis-related protein 1 [Bienertia sinuspersici]
MAISNKLSLAIVLVVGLTIAQLSSATLSPDLEKQLKNPNIDANKPLSDLINPVNPTVNNVVNQPINNAVNQPTTNPVTPPVNKAVNQPTTNPVTTPVNNAVNNLANILHEDPSEFLIPQNAARAKVSVPPFVWNETLAEFARSYAQERANDCKLQHSHSPGKGENIARAPGVLSPAKAVEMWVSEEVNYDYASNTCKKVCGHYTQVVWKGSTSIGCARSNCQGRGTFVTCNYYPPGNYIGRKPY